MLPDENTGGFMSLDINNFCAGQDEVRYYLHAPWRQPEGIVACNGHIFVCIKDDGRALDNPGDARVKARISQWLSEMRNEWSPLNVNLPPLQDCINQYCKKGVTHCDCEEGCDDCGGTKLVECWSCCGTGKLVKEPIDIGLCSIARRYLALIIDLPGLVVSPDGAEKMMAFRFDGGRGGVMPVRR